ncbi:E3 ubiquitin-protein ligase UPL6-like [Gossypium australe]|uniref:E3 ubiquitin-protein ligase UPL6-like n=1 Tax=Gossypium australe TaxID=47621 RepID=A0A5B6UCV3_9ROSI|nr:E3 ubiquitin-protein ligase UPL6-like [Gossypium australe]
MAAFQGLRFGFTEGTQEGVKDTIDGSNNTIQPGRNFTYNIEISEVARYSAWAAATLHGAFVILPVANEDYPALSAWFLCIFFSLLMIDWNCPGSYSCRG